MHIELQIMRELTAAANGGRCSTGTAEAADHMYGAAHAHAHAHGVANEDTYCMEKEVAWSYNCKWRDLHRNCMELAAAPS